MDCGISEMGQDRLILLSCLSTSHTILYLILQNIDH